MPIRHPESSLVYRLEPDERNLVSSLLRHFVDAGCGLTS